MIFPSTWLPRVLVAVAAVVVAVVVLMPPASAQTVSDIEIRDQQIANQEALLNVYRCLFDIDTQIVPGGCADGAPGLPAAQPGPFLGTPTLEELTRRDELIAAQEAQLNVYRCLFNIDVEIVPGRCVDDPEPPGAAGASASTQAGTDGQPETSLLDLLNSLTVEAESNASGYNRGHFEHDRRYLCDTSGSDPYTGLSFNSQSCDVDHIVAAQEAFESGAWAWSVSLREEFGNDEANLVATRDCVNRSKGARDMAEWSGRIGSGVCAGTQTTVQGRCFLATKMIQVKAAYSLSVDLEEKTALTEALEGCA